MHIADTLFVYSVPAREQIAARALRQESNRIRAPLFRLGLVAPRADDSGEPSSLSQNPSNSPERDPCEVHSADTESNKNVQTARSLYENRIASLENVLADPGRHAARMARALYRCAEGKGQRLMARSEHDLLLDHCNYMADDTAYAASAAGRFMQHFLIDTS